MAMVFQNYALYPHMTVEQNLGFGLKLRRLPKDESDGAGRRMPPRSSASSELLTASPRELSGGQRQRVAWAARWSASRRRS